ncbi:hypothetical protein [Arthrobacter sp. NA-172]|uniref:hypothetical protein n=1 Tax=Arthrobacter sp. NA-172 TaxID=3367524 RepID=UPI003754AC2A
MVEVRGRVFTGADGHTYARPRMHPDEQHTSLREQAKGDTTTSRIRVTGFESFERQHAHRGRPWYTIRGILRGMSIEVDAVLGPPEQWLDSWELADPRLATSEPDVPTEWLLSPERKELLEGIFASHEQRMDFYPLISLGLNGTYSGTFRVSLYVMAIDESFASWAENYSPDDLLVRSFVRAL